MQEYRPNPGKEYGEVRADFGLDGSSRPLKFRPENGPAVAIRRIPDVRLGHQLRHVGPG